MGYLYEIFNYLNNIIFTYYLLPIRHYPYKNVAKKGTLVCVVPILSLLEKNFIYTTMIV